jgi:hypothetical protein
MKTFKDLHAGGNGIRGRGGIKYGGRINRGGIRVGGG